MWLLALRLGLVIGGLLALALVLSGCTGAGLQVLQEEIEALRQRVSAREEIKIHIANAEQPVTKTAQRSEPTEPHVTVAVPPCPPAGAGILSQVIAKKKATGRAPRKGRLPR